MKKLAARLHPLFQSARLGGMVFSLAISVLIFLTAFSGCGEKIAIPEAIGLWANLAYTVEDTFPEPDIRQLTTGWGNLFVITSDSLSKRNQEYESDYARAMDNPTALCLDESGGLVFVWEQTQAKIIVFGTTELDSLGEAHLPEVLSVSSMVTCPAGMDSTILGGRTFLYLSDPVAGLIHRYSVMGAPDGSFTCSDCLLSAGLLAWPTGSGARSIHDPGGLALDYQERLLVCEMDPDRNWVTRFAGEPDSTDATPIPFHEELGPAMAGKAILFDTQVCEPDPAATEYVLGDAAGCSEGDWVGGPSEANGEFDKPTAVAVDGSGKIFVADFGNSRVQIFNRTGDYQAQFKIKDDFSQPISLGLVDFRKGADDVFYGAYIFVLTEGSGRVLKYISDEKYLDDLGELPPHEE